MQSIVHLWNVSKFFENSDNPDVLKLRMHYTQCCRELSDRVELPKQNFGSSAMCQQCGNAWSMTRQKTRISSGKTPSKSMEKLIKRSRDTPSRLPKYLRTLARKCEQNRSNKMTRICLICSEITKFNINKPKRRKNPKTNSSIAPNVTLSSKKKKKRARDRTAGLNLSGSQTPETNRMSDARRDTHKTPVSVDRKNRAMKLKTLTPIIKPKKLNLARLKGIIDKKVTPSKKSKLHTFLQELG